MAASADSTVILDITNFGAWLIKDHAPQPGWYAEKPPVIAYRAYEVAELLACLTLPHPREEIQAVSAAAEKEKRRLTDQEQATLRRLNKENDDWAKIPYRLEITAKQRDAVAECIRFFMKKGAFPILDVQVNLYLALGIWHPSSKSAAIHKLSVTNGAAILLRGVLPNPRWCVDKSESIMQAAYDVIQQLEHVKQPVSDDDTDSDEKTAMNLAWAKEPLEVSLTESQRNAARECFQYFMKTGQLTFTRDVALLIRHLGLTEE